MKHLIDQLVKSRDDLIAPFKQAVEIINQGGVYHLIFKIYKHKRSLAQNNLMWMWNHEIARWFSENTETEVDQNDVHEFLCERFWPKTVNPLTNKSRRIETKNFSVIEMKYHLEHIEWFCAEKEIPLTQPYDYDFAMNGERVANKKTAIQK